MTRLPTPGSDDGVWGNILNDYLSAAHKVDGTLKDNAVTEANLAPEVVEKLNAAGVSSVATLTGDITSPDLVDALETDLQLHYALVAGSNLTASGTDSWAQGRDTVASGNYSHAQGRYSSASGSYSHAEGFNTHATGSCAHTEGNTTVATGSRSHAEGEATQAQGTVSHAEGMYACAIGTYSHAEGYYTTTFRSNESTRGCGGYVQQACIPATFSTANQTGVTYVAAGIITVPIHGGITSGKITVLTGDGTIRWDITFSANNNATAYATRSTGTVSILASVGTASTTYGTSAITWTVTGNSTGQVVITPSAAPPERQVWCELLQLGSREQTSYDY